NASTELPGKISTSFSRQFDDGDPNTAAHVRDHRAQRQICPCVDHARELANAATFHHKGVPTSTAVGGEKVLADARALRFRKTDWLSVYPVDGQRLQLIFLIGHFGLCAQSAKIIPDHRAKLDGVVELECAVE